MPDRVAVSLSLHCHPCCLVLAHAPEPAGPFFCVGREERYAGSSNKGRGFTHQLFITVDGVMVLPVDGGMV